MNGFADGRRNKSEQDVHGGRFARAVRSKKSEDFAWLNRQIQTFQRFLNPPAGFPTTVFHPKIFYLQYRFHSKDKTIHSQTHANAARNGPARNK